jgi:hypothetical protein
MRCRYEDAKYPAKIHDKLTNPIEFLYNSL